MGLEPTSMAVSPTPGHREYAHVNATEGSVNVSVLPGSPGEFQSYDLMRILPLVIASVGLVGNATVLWLLGFRIRRNPFSVYILNLAGADSLFLCGVLFLSVQHVFRYFPYGFINDLVDSASLISYCVGLSFLAAISTERCLSALFPIWYRCHRPRHTSTVVSAVIWGLTVIFGIVNHIYYFHLGSSKLSFHFSVIWSLWFFFLSLVLCVSSLTLLLRVRCSSQRRQPPRLYGLVLLTVLVFLLCGLPMGIRYVMESWNLKLMPYWLPAPLSCVNSSANPFIYFFLGSQRRRRGKEPLRVILRRALGDDQELASEARDNSQNTTLETSS